MINQNKLRQLFFVVIIQLCFTFCVSQNHEVLFETDNIEFFHPTGSIKKDSILYLISNIERLNVDSARVLFPELNKVDPERDVTRIKGETPYLSALNDYYMEFSRDSDKLLLLTIFLRHYYNSTNTLYDKMLCGSLRLNNNNPIALYLLAKHRYENNLAGDSYYLLNQLSPLLESKDYVDFLLKSINEKYKVVFNKKFTFEEFIKQDIKYYSNGARL